MYKYYKDVANNDYKKELLYIVVYENSRKLSDGSIETWKEAYNVIDGHCEIKDELYLTDSCVEIEKDEYLLVTKGYYTPNEYLN